MDRLIYDLEIIKAIPDKRQPLIDGILYCDSWVDYKGMGISVISNKFNSLATECDNSALDFYCKTTIIELHVGDICIVGFNSKSFDDKVCNANIPDSEKEIIGDNPIKTDYDLLEQIRIAAGFQAHFQSVPKGCSYKLDALAKANNMAKTGSGELAPIMWQQGDKDGVRAYCAMDVEITSGILDLGLAGELVDPNTGKKLQLASLEEVYQKSRYGTK
jgi:hypothetical protein